MLDLIDLRRALAAHLEYYRDLGVNGFSRDPLWARRPSDGREQPTVDDTILMPRKSPAPSKSAASVPASASAAAIATPASTPKVTPAPAPAPAVAAFAAGAAPVADVETALRDPRLALTEIRTDIGDCTRCKLHKLGRTQIVYGVGNPEAGLMFVGEAPGADEDVQGEPFVGRAGQLLTKIIEAIGLKRDDVYIANVIKCRPPQNRNPEPDEIATCEPFLFRQIDAIKPKVIVALGTFAAQTLLKTQTPISKLRGQTHAYRGAQLIATFHPAFLLRSPERKRDVWEDMKRVRALLQGEDA